MGPLISFYLHSKFLNSSMIKYIYLQSQRFARSYHRGQLKVKTKPLHELILQMMKYHISFCFNHEIELKL